MVAAWISADTGVGPAIASGSHTNRGICALFPVAPIKRRSATEVRPPARIAPQLKSLIGMLATVARALVTPVLSKKLIEGAPAFEVSQKSNKMPRTNPQSPTRLAMNAFLAAGAASGLSR